MRIPTRDIPQADNLDLIVKCTEAVSRGARTFQELAKELGYDPRQGRYYRRAAEILGLIRNAPRLNRAYLTPTGRVLLKATVDRRRQMLAKAILSSRVFQRILPFLDARRREGANRQQLRQFIANVTEPTTESMLNRRFSSLVGWLLEIGLVRRDGDLYFLEGLPAGVDIIEYVADDEPIFPRSYKLAAYEETARRAKQQFQSLTVLVNAAARERANESHRTLTNLVANKIRAAGGIPRRNRFIDLMATIRDTAYLFEMKSTTHGNYHSQVRHGISQLFEYRYIQRLEPVSLVLVTEQPPPNPLRWIKDYLLNDRGILLTWDGDGKSLDCPAASRDQLNFLL